MLFITANPTRRPDGSRGTRRPWTRDYVWTRDYRRTRDYRTRDYRTREDKNTRDYRTRPRGTLLRSWHDIN